MENAGDKENVFLPVTAMVLGIVATAACFGSSPLDVEASIGMMGISGAALTIGIACVAKQKRGSGMAIAGIVLGCIGLLGALGSFTK